MPDPIYRMTAFGVAQQWSNVHAPNLHEALVKYRNVLKVCDLVPRSLSAYTITLGFGLEKAGDSRYHYANRYYADLVNGTILRLETDATVATWFRK